MKLILFIEDEDGAILMDRKITLEKETTDDRTDYILPPAFSISEFLRQADIEQLAKRMRNPL